MKSVRIRSFSGPYFPAFELNTERYYSVRMRENTDQKNSEYGHFLRSASDSKTVMNNKPSFKFMWGVISKLTLWANTCSNLTTKTLGVVLVFL